MSLFRRKISKSKSVKSVIPPCSVVIAAAGSSARMGGEDKLFSVLSGAPVLAHTLRAYQRCERVSEIIIVARVDMVERIAGICNDYGIGKAAKIIVGGEVRSDSVRNGVFAVSESAGLIAIHDGARPCIDAKVIANAIDAAAKHYAAVPAIPVSSTVKRAADGIVTETVSREGLFEIQTPQVFDADLIKAALTNAGKKQIEITDDCMAVELLGAPVYITEGSRCNIKITTQEDLVMAEAIIGSSRE